MPDENPNSRSVLFLDIDDTICLHRPFGGYDVLEALIGEDKGTAPLESHRELWAHLFDRGATHRLSLLHAEFRPMYVLSTSWTRIFDDASLRRVLRLGGLEFVAANLHDHSSTPTRRGPYTRWEEIGDWLDAHPELAEQWVVLDDELSGTGLQDSTLPKLAPFIAICKVGAGLTDVEYRQLRDALSVRTRREV